MLPLLLFVIFVIYLLQINSYYIETNVKLTKIIKKSNVKKCLNYRQ